jgi:ribonucleoside-diphosphate reductase alpha chain
MSKIEDFRESLDPAHKNMGFFTGTLTKDIWSSKYKFKDERDFTDTVDRVIDGIYLQDPDKEEAGKARFAMLAGLWMPAGRILAGAGTGKRVTLMNCFVNARVKDSMESIMQGVSFAALTMQQGGGIGTDFSTIRPEGAILKRTGTKASGPMPFMDMWNSMCTTIRSAGDRRGAMMGVISDTHPDLPKFIVAKRTAGKLTNFNISVLVSDAFMEAVKEDEEWYLHFSEEPWERSPELGGAGYDFIDDKGVLQYVYSVWKARDLWKLITENSYEYSEPGVIFIDRVNELNNLNYCEEIRCTNPCGEQTLPPHGACNLGHVNLARMVSDPFTDMAQFDFELLRKIVRVGVRFLDNVLDVTGYPLREQEVEAYDKRRIGLGFTGLADALAQLRLRYGHVKSADMAEKIMVTIMEESYHASIDLSMERGSFPLFDSEKYLNEQSFAGVRLPETIKARIRQFGIRNGLLNSIAPTGTTSIVYGNPSGGLEPIFAHYIQRNVLQEDGSFKPYKEYGYAARLYKYLHMDTHEHFPAYMVTTEDLTIHDHLLIQSRVQRWVDASISKTINISAETPYDEFVQVYEMAYNSGCKGCTTYRPSAVRGSILQDADATEEKKASEIVLRQRAEVLNGRTYKIKWPNRNASLYLTINSDETGKPFEVFITSKDGTYSEWTTAVALLITAIFRQGGDIAFVPKELKQIQSMRDGAWINKRYVGSLPAYIGQLIEQHLQGNSNVEEDTIEEAPETLVTAELINQKPTGGGDICPACNAPALFYMEGCNKCTNCGHSECG